MNRDWISGKEMIVYYYLLRYGHPPTTARLEKNVPCGKGQRLPWKSDGTWGTQLLGDPMIIMIGVSAPSKLCNNFEHSSTDPSPTAEQASHVILAALRVTWDGFGVDRC